MSLIFADVVWPALFLSGRLADWWCIAASLLIEAAALWWFLHWRPLKSLAASAVMNAASAFCGTFLLPVAGIRWEMIADRTYNAWFGWGTFNPVTEVATWFIAVVLCTIIETFILWLVFCAPWTRRLIIVVLCANAVTVALASITLAFAPR